MRRKFLIGMSAALFLPVVARADLPPPPDDYTGPAQADVAGLTFEHQLIGGMGYWHYLESELHDTNPLDFRGTWVILSGCDSKHPNCRLAKRLGAIGGAVSKINGAPVGPNGDVAEVEKAFADAGSKGVTLTLLIAEGAQAPRALKTVTLVAAGR